MPPSRPPRRPRNSSRINLLISAVSHAAVVGALTYFAAREGLLGKELRKIAVQLVKEKPPEPEKPKEPEKPREKPPEEKKPEEPKDPTPPPDTPPPTAPITQRPPTANLAAPPAVAPPSADVPSFVFTGGRAVQSSSDPVQLYRGLMEYALRSRWNRPTDVSDSLFVAEVEVAVDREGRISDPVWKKEAGHAAWDASVRAAVAATTSISRPPPTNFPPRVVVRFDVQEVPDELAE